jgi:N-acetylornithine carbamoyltransferase
MPKRDFLKLPDLDRTEISGLLELAAAMKSGRFRERPLTGKTLALIFTKSSTRTRVSFEVGMVQLGGYALFLSARDMQLGRGEPIADTARVLSRYVDGIMIRTYSHEEVEELACHSTVPVINGLTDLLHPCQVLADYLTIRERFGETRGLKLGVAWTSAPNYVRPLSVPQSLILLMPRFGLDVTLAYPPEFRLMPEIEERARKNAEETGARFEISHRFEDAFDDADVVIPKSWGPLVHTRDHDEGIRLIQQYPAWRCDAERMALGKERLIYMHPLPADRGREVTDEVIDGPQSVVYDEAENRLHVQKALMALTMA